MMIKMVNICKGFQVGEDSVQILKNINFNVDEGEFVAILGPSGSGKTTLMNIIGCMDVAGSGEYYLDGQAIHTMEEQDLGDIRNKEIGFIFQNYQLIPTYNILQNIIMPLIVRGMSTAEAEDKCMETIKLLGIDHRLRHKPSELSGGQKQRVSIARALVGEPAILLADEPTGALDRSSGQDVLKLFKQLNEMGHTIVMITHDLNVAKNASRIVHIIDGQLSED
jgi:putative ABC transport system ATP-binding protein